jgi:hypothetical protein
MTVAQAIAELRSAARNANESAESAEQCERAIRALGLDFERRSRCTRQRDNIALTSGNRNLPSFVSGNMIDFRPSRLVRAYISTHPPLEVMDYAAVMWRHYQNVSSDMPAVLGFQTYTSGAVWPTPDQDYTLEFLWRPKFTSWVIGDGDDTELNIPEEILIGAIRWGGAAFLQSTYPEQGYAKEAWQRYLAYAAECRSANTLGSTSADRGSLADLGDSYLSSSL